ncbi:hypothetical protein DL767_005984 [Monosporascus sp. MG133]|nr:hypothetical protein DL767_005984 [Monosporascus sp. MG133]
MAATNSVGALRASGHSRVHIGNVYNEVVPVPERPETPPRPSSTIPFRRDADFVERKTILDRIHQACSTPASRVALVGLGGVGKSQLAIEHAYRVRDTFINQDKEVWAFWVHAGTRARVEEGFKAIADAAKIPGRGQPKADILQLVYQWLQNERNGQWLMVLDSADDVNVFYGTDEKAKQTASIGEGVRPLWTYLPQSSNGSTLITTRDKDLAFKLTGDHKNIIEVGPMDQDHALTLLATKSGSQYNRDEGTKLVKELEYMPLAISQAAAYIVQRAPRTSVRKYLEEFRKSERKRWGLLNHDAGDIRRDGSASNSVVTTWQISFDYIRSKRPSATDLLSLMSFFDNQGILEYLLRPIDQDESYNDEANTEDESLGSSETSSDGFEEDVAMLRNYCLISTNETGDVFEMHGLVQLSTREWLNVHEKTEKFKKQYINRMARAFPSGDFHNWGTCRQLFPHAEKAIHYRPIDKEYLSKWALILYNGSWFSVTQGKYTIAETMATKAQNAYETVLGPDHPSTLTSMNRLAFTYRHQGRWKEAELIQVQVMETGKRVLGEEHPGTLTSINNLALTYRDQGRWKEAESVQVQVMETRKRVLGEEYPETLISMNDLALTYRDQGRWKEAELLQVQVIKIRKRVLGEEHPVTLISMNNLALTYQDQGRWKEADSLQVQVMEMRKRALGIEHPDTLASMAHLAVIFLKQGRFKDMYLLGREFVIKLLDASLDHADSSASLYTHAEFCLVHLDESNEPEEWIREWDTFRKDRSRKPNFTSFGEIDKKKPQWATRGWSLQESILSKNTFYVNSVWGALSRPVENLGSYYYICPFISLDRSENSLFTSTKADEDATRIEVARKLIIILEDLGVQIPKDIDREAATSRMAEAVYFATDDLSKEQDTRNRVNKALLDILNGYLRENAPEKYFPNGGNARKVIDFLLKCLVAEARDPVLQDREYIANFTNVKDLSSWQEGTVRTKFPAEMVMSLATKREVTSSRALSWLMDEIVISSNDVSVFNWSGIEWASPIRGRSLHPSSLKAFKLSNNTDNERAELVQVRMHEVIAAYENTFTMLRNGVIRFVKKAQFAALQQQQKSIGKILMYIQKNCGDVPVQPKSHDKKSENPRTGSGESSTVLLGMRPPLSMTPSLLKGKMSLPKFPGKV